MAQPMWRIWCQYSPVECWTLIVCVSLSFSLYIFLFIVNVNLSFISVCVMSRNTSVRRKEAKEGKAWEFSVLCLFSSWLCVCCRLYYSEFGVKRMLWINGSCFSCRPIKFITGCGLSQFCKLFLSWCSTAGCPGVVERYFKFPAWAQSPSLPTV